MSRAKRWLAIGTTALSLWGCGGDSDEKKPAAPAPAPVAAPAPARPAPPDAKSSAAAAAAEFLSLLQYLPENLSLAAGANFAAIAEKNEPIGRRLTSQFQPILAVLARASINSEHIEQIWGGSNRATDDFVVCVRTRARYDNAAANSAWGASGEPEKIGKASVFTLATTGDHKDAVAHLDGRNLLLGRYNTIVAALKNPGPGTVRRGLQPLLQSKPYFWLAGDRELAAQHVGAMGGEALDRLLREGGDLPGWAVAFTGSANPTLAELAALSANAELDGEFSELEGPPALQGLPPSAPGAGDVRFVELSLGLNLGSEPVAQLLERKFTELMTVLRTPPPPGTPPLPAQRLMLRSLTRDKDAVRIAVALPTSEQAILDRLISTATQATVASAISDGVFDGTLTSLSAGLLQWADAQPDGLKGVRRVGDLHVRFGYSWMSELLPYLGHKELYAAFDRNKSWLDRQNFQHACTTIPAFLNPSDPRSHWQGSRFDGMALTHFAGMSGVEDRPDVVAGALPRNDPRAGIFGYDEVAKLRDIADGANNTIMIVGTGAAAAPWVQGGGATIRGARAPYFDNLTGLGSRGLPKQGTFVLMADGSARVLSAEIDPAVFQALCTIHGGEAVDTTKLSLRSELQSR